MHALYARLPRWGLWLPGLVLCLVAWSPAQAWDEQGHVIVARLAIEGLPESAPAWLRTPRVRSRIEYLASQPDRWRGQHNVHLDHINGPEHYIDEELLEPYGLSIKTLPPLRREYTDLLATQRALHPDRFEPYDRGRDRAYTRLSPGLLPYRIVELQWKLAASWTQLKTYEAHRAQATEEMIRNERENIVYLMGILSHYVGDGAQPLHTTKHYNGWTGPNPKGYTTDKGFHRFIDAGILTQFGITPQSLLPRARPARSVSTTDYWAQICGYLYETHQLAEPLYALEASGELYKAKGRQFIEDRLLEAGAMLAGIWMAAHDGAVIDEFRARRLEKRAASRARSKDRPPLVPSVTGRRLNRSSRTTARLTQFFDHWNPTRAGFHYPAQYPSSGSVAIRWP
jgi:hypothetical protein